MGKHQQAPLSHRVPVMSAGAHETPGPPTGHTTQGVGRTHCNGLQPLLLECGLPCQDPAGAGRGGRQARSSQGSTHPYLQQIWFKSPNCLPIG